MSVRRHIGFGSTPNLGNLYKEVKANQGNEGRLKFANYDPSLGEPPTEEQKELLQNYQPTMPTINFKGSEKLHGENMAVCYSQGELWVQGRNHIRTLLGDQNGMAAFVDSTLLKWTTLVSWLENRFSINTDSHTIVIDCEWAGGNIQKGNAACSGTDKGAYIFEYFRVVNNTTDENQSYSTRSLEVFPDSSIYLMSSFGVYGVQLDLNNPTECEEKLKYLAEEVEDNSPIARYFNKPDNVGEGVYLYGTDVDGTTYRLKAKGDKHGGKPKVKRVQSPMDSDLEAKLLQLADEVTPTWRLSQAVSETGATETKHVGEVIKWVLGDVIKEEMPKLHEAGVEPKQLRSYLASITKEYYFSSIKGY